MPSRHVRIVVHNAELLSARTATQTKQKQQQTSKGIESVSIGGTTIKFAHDMTTTFKWGGLILGLVLFKILRKGKYAWTEEPNFKYISRNAVEEAELHEFQCESCEFSSLHHSPMPKQLVELDAQVASLSSPHGVEKESSFPTTTAAKIATLRRRCMRAHVTTEFWRAIKLANLSAFPCRIRHSSI